nr:MAG TPA: hypothetical protein [Caudoviricetes sp.]
MAHDRRRKRLKSAVTRANVHEAGARVQTAAMNWACAFKHCEVTRHNP